MRRSSVAGVDDAGTAAIDGSAALLRPRRVGQAARPRPRAGSAHPALQLNACSWSAGCLSLTQDRLQALEALGQPEMRHPGRAALAPVKADAAVAAPQAAARCRNRGRRFGSGSTDLAKLLTRATPCWRLIRCLWCRARYALARSKIP